ncbi:MAG: hypothetical protein R3C45_19720 [Phycisphaerales bacterium]
MQWITSLAVLLCLALPCVGESYLLVANHQGGDSVSRYDLDGNWLGHFVTPGSGGLDNAVGMQIGADGNLYVASEGTGQVLRYNGHDGTFMDVFASGPSLQFVGYLTIGPNGDFYAAGAGNNTVVRSTVQQATLPGAAASGGGLNGPDGIVFTSAGELLVSSYFSNSVKRYNPETGAYLGDFVAGGGLIRPLQLVIEGDQLQVVSQGTNSIRRYNLDTGAYLGDLLIGGGLNNPIAQVVLPNGDRVVSSYSNSSLVRFDAGGVLQGVFASGAGSGVVSPTTMILVPEPTSVAILGCGAFVFTRRRARA